MEPKTPAELHPLPNWVGKDWNLEVDSKPLVCRMCGIDPETGNHIALVCPAGEWLGRRWSSWDKIHKERWIEKERDGGRTVITDRAEGFLPV